MNRVETEPRRMTWVDWTIFGLLLCVTVAVSVWAIGRRETATSAQSIVYTLCVSAADPLFAEASDGWEGLIPANAPVTSSNGAISLGYVVSHWVEPHLEARLQNGEVVLVPREGRVDLYVQIRAEATSRTGDGLRVGDVRIAAADTGDFRVGGYLAHGARVVSVESEGIS